VDITLRALGPDDQDAFVALDDAAFSNRSTPEQRAQALATTEWASMLGAFGGGRLWGVAGSLAQRLTVPGGARLPVAGVTAVGVLPTHRRRGVLRALMGRQLKQVADAGCPLAVLTASEATIYRRFGYGVASRHQSVRLDRARSTFLAADADRWTLELVDDAAGVELAPGCFEAYVASRVGGLTRPDSFWPFLFGATETWLGGGEHFTVVCRSAATAEPAGYALYKVRHQGASGHWVTEVAEVVAADPGAEASLWRYLLDIDLTEALEIGAAPLDDALAWRLVDGRAHQVTGQADHLWVRLVDPAAALAARTYGSTDALVIEVVDPFRPASSGRYRVQAEAGRAGQVSPTEAPADLVLDVADLGSLYLGGVSATTLARAGRLQAAQPVVARADRFLAAEHQPFCLTRF
jgi:predicted acetyltransferase